MATYKGKDVQGVLEQFRAALEERDLIHPEDTIGADDPTLLFVASLSNFFCRLCVLTASFCGTGRRFLRARQFDVDKSVAMWAHCQEWRKTVAGDGIDELCKRLDPLDVCVFRSLCSLLGRDHRMRARSIRSRRRWTSTAGPSHGTRYAYLVCRLLISTQ